jgi:regulator of replication initiation timing
MDLENHRIKNDERREVAIDLLEMVANDVSKLKQQSEDYEQAFGLASTEIDNLKRELQLLEQTSPHQPETSSAQSSKEVSEKEEFVQRLTDDAVHACQNQPVTVAFEALSQGQTAPSGIWPADWDVAIIVREFDRRAANVNSN